MFKYTRHETTPHLRPLFAAFWVVSHNGFHCISVSDTGMATVLGLWPYEIHMPESPIVILWFYPNPGPL